MPWTSPISGHSRRSLRRWRPLLVALLAGGMTAALDAESLPIPLHAAVTHVQPLTGIVLWADNSSCKTAPIQLEYIGLSYAEVIVGRDKYDWTALEKRLNNIAARRHQAVLRWHDTYVNEPTGVPAYIKAMPDYHETQGVSEKKPTGFPDWSHLELQRCVLEFFSQFAAKYDRDPRLAFMEVGFGLWAEYHIYDGPMVLGRTFPSKTFQATFARHLSKVFQQTPWMISVDAAGDHTPFAGDRELLALRFGLFDDSFNHAGHTKENEPNWLTFGPDRWKTAPTGGEFSFFQKVDQSQALSPSGPHGVSFKQQAAKFHISFMIGDAQPRHQTADRIRSAGLACGYRFAITEFRGDGKSFRVTVANAGIAPIYHDAFVAINGARAKESLKGLLPGEHRSFDIPARGQTPVLTIESDRLVPGQQIEYDADL